MSLSVCVAEWGHESGCLVVVRHTQRRRRAEGEEEGEGVRVVRWKVEEAIPRQQRMGQRRFKPGFRVFVSNTHRFGSGYVKVLYCEA